MLAVQLRLGLATPAKYNSPEQIRLQRKHELIRGRPRRLSDGSKVVKVAVTPQKAIKIDRIRQMMNATRPECVRNAVHMLIGKYADVDSFSAGPKTKRLKAGNRCEYWKVPFSPSTLAGIERLAAKLGPKRRQQIINLALDEMLKLYV